MPGIGGFILHSDRDFFDSFTRLRSYMNWGDNYREAFFQDPDLNMAVYACASPALSVSRITHLNRYESLLVGELYPADNFHSDKQLSEAHLNILHGIIRQPSETLNKISGAFLIAVWDAEKKRMIIANDAFGLLPVNYSEVPASLIFSSQLPVIKMLLTQPEIGRPAFEKKIATDFPLHGKTFLILAIGLYQSSFLTVHDKKMKEKHFHISFYVYESGIRLGHTA